MEQQPSLSCNFLCHERVGWRLMTDQMSWGSKDAFASNVWASGCNNVLIEQHAVVGPIWPKCTYITRENSIGKEQSHRSVV